VNQKTGETLSLWKYVQGSARSNRETLEELARLANYTLPGLSQEDAEKIRERNDRADLLQEAHAFPVSELWSPKGKKVLIYLKARC
jgi:DNA primase